MWLSIIVVIPVIAAIILSLFPKSTDPNVFRYGTLLATFAVLAAVIMAFFFPGTFEVGEAGLQQVELRSWIGGKAFTIDYFMGIDGISFPLIVLTAGVSILAMVASWSITRQVKGYCILFLLLETGMLGVFPRARLLPVLYLLGSHAPADVFLDRYLGWPEKRIRRDQVLPLHAVRKCVDADRDPDALLRE